MECYFNESSSFSPIPQPRRTQSRTTFSITNNFNYDGHNTSQSFELMKEECETPRTMPRKPRKTHLTPVHKTLNKEQIQRSSLASASYHEASIQRLTRPNAPPPPLPLNSHPSLIESIPDYYNTISHNMFPKNPSTDCSEVFNSTFSSNLSTPKISRADLLFDMSSDNLISDKKRPKIVGDRTPGKDEFHIGFKTFESSGLYHSIKLPLKRQVFKKKNEKRANLCTRVNQGFYSPGRFLTTKTLFNCTVIFLGTLTIKLKYFYFLSLGFIIFLKIISRLYLVLCVNGLYHIVSNKSASFQLESNENSPEFVESFQHLI